MPELAPELKQRWIEDITEAENEMIAQAFIDGMRADGKEPTDADVAVLHELFEDWNTTRLLLGNCIAGRMTCLVKDGEVRWSLTGQGFKDVETMIKRGQREEEDNT